MTNKDLKKISSISFSIGSVRGLAFVPAFEALLNRGLRWKNIQHCRGASAGAFMAFAVAVGLPLSEMWRVFQNFSLSLPLRPRFQKGRFSVLDQTPLQTLVLRIFLRLGLSAAVTFRDLPGAELSVVVRDCATHELTTLSKATSPDAPVLQALLASAAIPVLFPAVRVGTRLFEDPGFDLEAFGGTDLGVFLFDKFRPTTLAALDNVVFIDVSRCSAWAFQPTERIRAYLHAQALQGVRDYMAK